MDETDDPGRAARARLHLLPSGARARRPGRADAADARRADDRGDRPRLPRPRADDGEAARPREAQDQGRRHPVPRAAGAPAPRPARRGARRRLSDLQRGLRRPRRPRGGGDPARARARRADARRARGARTAGADAGERRPARRALRRRRRSSCSATRTARSGTPTQIAAGRAALDRALALGGRGPYVAAGGDRRRCTSDEPPDWPQLAALYGELARLTGSPVVELNRAARSPRPASVEAALALVEGLELDRLPLPARDARRAAAPARSRRGGARRPTSARSSSSTRTPSGASSSGGWPSSETDLPRR